MLLLAPWARTRTASMVVLRGTPRDGSDRPVRSHRQSKGTNLHNFLSHARKKSASFIGGEFTLFSFINSST